MKLLLLLLLLLLHMWHIDHRVPVVVVIALEQERAIIAKKNYQKN
jgi:hypothetical protein